MNLLSENKFYSCKRNYMFTVIGYILCTFTLLASSHKLFAAAKEQFSMFSVVVVKVPEERPPSPEVLPADAI